jgi:hypothetical protein
MAKADEALRARELTITEEKKRWEDKTSQQERLKKTNHLKKGQLLFDSGNAQRNKKQL